MKIWLDDERPAPGGWIHVFWPDEAIDLLDKGSVETISLDHDLGDDERGTGYDVLLWIEQRVIEHGYQPPEIRIHTANSAARKKMEAGLGSIKRRANG